MDYSQLPEDILLKIVEEHLPYSFSHFIAFAHVCKSWRAAAQSSNTTNSRRRPCRPGLLISRAYSDTHDFMPLTKFPAALAPPPPSRTRRHPPPRRRLLLRRRRLEIPLGLDPISFDSDDEPITEPNPCLASKDGWVLVPSSTRPDPALRLQLFNPITRQSIALPPLLRDGSDDDCGGGGQFTIDNIAIISSSPQDCSDDDDCHLFLLLRYDWDDMLASIKVARGGGGQQNWKFTILDPATFSRLWQGEACCCFGDKLYTAVGRSPQGIYILENLTTNPTMAGPIPFSSAMSSYANNQKNVIQLSHLDGQLLVIFYHYDWDDGLHRNGERSVTFHIYKLLSPAVNGAAGNGDDDWWEEVRSLDGHALFLSYSHSAFCLPASGYDGVEEDRIYFAFSWRYGYVFDEWRYPKDEYRNDCGVFNLADRTLESFVPRPFNKHDYFWFLLTPSDIFSASTELQDSRPHHHHRRRRRPIGETITDRERSRMRKRRWKPHRYRHRMDDHVVVAGRGEHPQSGTGYIYSSRNSDNGVGAAAMGTEWTVPKKSIKNHHHCHRQHHK